MSGLKVGDWIKFTVEPYYNVFVGGRVTAIHTNKRGNNPAYDVKLYGFDTIIMRYFKSKEIMKVTMEELIGLWFLEKG